MELVITEIKNRVGYVVLNRPEKRNALSPQLVGELTAAIQHLLHDDAVKVIVLKSADKPFVRAPIWPICRNLGILAARRTWPIPAASAICLI